MMVAEKAHSSQTDQIYHLTRRHLPSQIMVEGLKPFPERGEGQAWKLVEALLDNQRPERISKLGISRANGIFAAPEIEHLQGVYVPRERFEPDVSVSDIEEAIAIDVDPDRAVVCDAWKIGSLQTDFERLLAQGKQEPDELMMKKAKRYWDSSLTLRDFRSNFDLSYTPFVGVSYNFKPDAREELSGFLLPEVIVAGPIDPERLHWMASALHYIDEPLDFQARRS
jgi:hypothetical protein